MRVKRKSSLLSSSEVTVEPHGPRKEPFFPTCSNCGTPKMSSIPMGAHAAFKVRDSLNRGGDRNERHSSMSFSNADGNAGQPQATPPQRYNSKLMNSVWGMYNRYSVHNIKSHIAYEKS